MKSHFISRDSSTGDRRDAGITLSSRGRGLAALATSTFWLLALFLPLMGQAAESFEFADGDVVALVGNTVIERAQDFGHVETALTLAAGEGKSVVLLSLSPPPLENLPAPMPDQTVRNQRLSEYRDAIAELARKRGHRMVDLFAMMAGEGLSAGKLSSPRLTENGVHYTPEGYRIMAQEITRGLGLPVLDYSSGSASAETLRATIVAKNRLFFHRWRPANETYLFLFRKREQGQNAKEIPMFDPLIAARTPSSRRSVTGSTDWLRTDETHAKLEALWLYQNLNLLDQKLMCDLLASDNAHARAAALRTLYFRHAIGGVGGVIGPDLVSIGSSAPVDYLVESLIAPSKKIKEGYHTTLVITENGDAFAGAVARENGDEMVIRDAAGQEQRIAKADIAKTTVSPVSLMPLGLTTSLREDEFIDLVRFLSELGKEGAFKTSPSGKSRFENAEPVDAKGGDCISM